MSARRPEVENGLSANDQSPFDDRFYRFDHDTWLPISGWGIDHDRSHHPMRAMIAHFRTLTADDE